jgi:hypothetical protein
MAHKKCKPDRMIRSSSRNNSVSGLKIDSDAAGSRISQTYSYYIFVNVTYFFRDWTHDGE